MEECVEVPSAFVHGRGEPGLEVRVRVRVRIRVRVSLALSRDQILFELFQIFLRLLHLTTNHTGIIRESYGNHTGIIRESYGFYN